MAFPCARVTRKEGVRTNRRIPECCHSTKMKSFLHISKHLYNFRHINNLKTILCRKKFLKLKVNEPVVSRVIGV